MAPHDEALTPKSASLTDPSPSTSMLPALTSGELPVSVAIFQRLNNFPENGGDGSFVESLLVLPLEQVVARPAGKVGHHQPQRLAGHEAAMDLDEVGVGQHSHSLSLAANLLQRRGVLSL
eukprot:CAMPEP_0196582616 /NCGR_PEP_ID=MMETSP1081-20130531/39719_1 /TAXON_ID=36882 /ORGANISM="Pyramimonas amylifera, Strain CCMP720" /LENGTH=119 /DNA_ID=CAMNT_0041903233 /DNA_START=90 /DNA_END=451 /DNA_ORIENTATION=-